MPSRCSADSGLSTAQPRIRLRSTASIAPRQGWLMRGRRQPRSSTCDAPEPSGPGCRTEPYSSGDRQSFFEEAGCRCDDSDDQDVAECDPEEDEPQVGRVV